jgi:diacylglycerol kinase (ATP)
MWTRLAHDPRMPGPSRWYVVVNPASGGGRAARQWPRLADALARAGVSFEPVVTRKAGDAAGLVADAVRAGFRHVLAVGGDGVLHEALNGLMSQRDVPPVEVCLGAAPLGSGNDWARARGIPSEPGRAAAIVAACRTTRQDAGRIDFPDTGSACYFINVAGAGLDAYVLERLPRGVPRRLAYVLGLLRSLASYTPPRFRLEADGMASEATLLVALVGLGPYCGGGMRLTPQASLDDGRLDLLTVEPLRLPAELLRLRRLFDGRLAEERFAHHASISRLQVDALPAVAVQADGQLVGRTPCRVSLLPGALRVLAA